MVPPMSLSSPPALETLIAKAPDLMGLGQRPADASQWLSAGSDCGIEGLVPFLAAAGLLSVPEQILTVATERLRSAHNEQAFYRLLAQEAIGAMAACGIAVVQLKGSALADRVYPPQLARRCTDTDLLVLPQDFERAEQALRTLDYVERSAKLAAFQRRHHHDVQFVRPASPPLDLHSCALLAFGTAIATSEVMDAPGQLEPHAELIYLAAHAAAHNFERPVWTVDLALFIRAHPQLQVKRLDQLAAQWHLTRAWRHAQQHLKKSLGDSALPWPVASPTAVDRLSQAAFSRYQQRERHDFQRFLWYSACGLSHCDNLWRANWMGQFIALRAAGDLATQLGLHHPAQWPPLPGRPPPWSMPVSQTSRQVPRI